jgi:hypothetical protein
LGTGKEVISGSNRHYVSPDEARLAIKKADKLLSAVRANSNGEFG